MKRGIRIFRWKAIGPLLLLLFLAGVFWAIFGDRIIESTSAEASTDLLGTEVDISGMVLHETAARVDVARIQIADPFDSLRNIIETGDLVLDLDPAALLEKKLVIDQLRVSHLAFGTKRIRPARRARADGYAATLLGQVEQWATQFKVPLLSLTPVDTIRQLVLDPAQLSTIREAQAVLASADSLRDAFVRDFAGLGVRSTVDSARALADRLTGTSPAKLGLAGTRDAIQSIRRTISDIDQTRTRITQLERSAEAGVRVLEGGVAAVDQARQNDYAFARGLLKLPSFSAPDIGAALFGPVSIDRFQQAVYWAELARKHLPPGLLPQVRRGPERLRMAGTNIEYPKSRDFPSFLLRQGELDVSFNAFGGTHSLTAAVRGLTSQPAIYGHPATVAARGKIGGSHPMTLDAGALIDHVGGDMVDSVKATLTGVPLPAFSLPGLPFRVDPGAGVSGMDFTLRGDQVDARWTLRSSSAAWRRDSSAVESPVANLIWRVVSGLHELDVTAEMTGPLRAPRFTVHSNIGVAIADQVRAIIGDEVRKAEAKVRAEVDRLVADQVARVRTQVNTATSELTTRIPAAREELDSVKTLLEARLKSLTGIGGALGLPR